MVLMCLSVCLFVCLCVCPPRPSPIIKAVTFYSSLTQELSKRIQLQPKKALQVILGSQYRSWAEFFFGRKQGQQQKLEFSFGFNRYG